MNEDRKNTKSKDQNLTLINREKLNILGVIEVISFNDENIVVNTELGVLIIRGENLTINKLCTENSELNIRGDIYSLEYSDKDVSKTGFFTKLFK